MPSADPREPRPSSEQLNPTVIIAGTALIIVALVGAVFGAFVQDRYSSHSVAIPKEQRLEFAERAATMTWRLRYFRGSRKRTTQPRSSGSPT